MAAQVKEFASIQGRLARLNVAGVEPNLIVQPTQLISARVNSPRQWVMTMAQAMKGDSGTAPWTFPDGTPIAVNPILTAGGNIPLMPGESQALQVALRWGAGGAAFQTRFDYPIFGASFGLTADTVDLNVTLKNPAFSTTYASLAVVPVVGAFMVEGVAVEPSPVEWFERLLVVGAAPQSRTWSVKPYSKQLLLTASGSAGGADQVVWVDSSNTIIEVVVLPGDGTFGFDVPLSAVGIIYIKNGAPATSVALRWQINLL
jgi:hypothetical protein